MKPDHSEASQLRLSLAGLVDRLAERGGAAAEAERLEIYRLLHSIKSWAQVAGEAGLEAGCHGLEGLVRRNPVLGPAEIQGIKEVLEGFGPGSGSLDGAAVQRAGAGSGTPGRGLPAVWRLSAPHPVFQAHEVRLMHSLRLEGRELRCCRITVSPDEPMALTRLLVLHTRFEALGLIRAELWLARGGQVAGPMDPRDSLLGAGPEEDEGACGGWYRCYYAPPADAAPAGPGIGLQLDMTESVIDTEFAGQPWLQADFADCRLDFQPLDRLQLAVQTLAQTGPEGLSSDLRRSLVADIAARPAGAFFAGLAPKLVALGTEQGLAAGRVHWHFYDEGQTLPAHAWTVLEEAALQLARNSLVHGLETAEVRSKAGKPDQLRIAMSIFDQGSGFSLTYEEDGRGIDVAALSAVAGIPAADLQDPARLLETICRAELSTHAGDSRHAGRGMGMNLVAQLAAQVLGGRLSLANRPGHGLSFRIDLPGGLEELAVQVFQSGGGVLAIPQVLLAGIVPLASARIRRDRAGRPYLQHAGVDLPLARLPEAGCDRWLALVRSGALPAGAVPVGAYVGGESVLLSGAPDEVYSRRGQAMARLFRFGSGQPAGAIART